MSREMKTGQQGSVSSSSKENEKERVVTILRKPSYSSSPIGSQVYRGDLTFYVRLGNGFLVTSLSDYSESSETGRD